MAEAVLRAGSRARIIATSREPLRAEGERIYPVPPLAVPAEVPSMATTSCDTAPSGCSWTGRGRRSRGLRRTRALRPAIAAICRRLDGIPLAIELAAARVAALGIEDVAARLDDRFQLLTGGRRTALPRHQTLRATLDWSYELLAEPERIVLRRLGIFPGFFDLEAARAVAADADLAPVSIVVGLSDLVAKSMIAAHLDTASTRYRLLETTRAYALEKADECGEREQLARRHAEYFRQLFERAEADLETRPTAEWLADYGRHIDDLRAALDWAFSPNGDTRHRCRDHRRVHAALAPVVDGGRVSPACRTRSRLDLGAGVARRNATASGIGPVVELYHRPDAREGSRPDAGLGNRREPWRHGIPIAGAAGPVGLSRGHRRLSNGIGACRAVHGTCGNQGRAGLSGDRRSHGRYRTVCSRGSDPCAPPPGAPSRASLPAASAFADCAFSDGPQGCDPNPFGAHPLVLRAFPIRPSRPPGSPLKMPSRRDTRYRFVTHWRRRHARWRSTPAICQQPSALPRSCSAMPRNCASPAGLPAAIASKPRSLIARGNFADGLPLLRTAIGEVREEGPTPGYTAFLAVLARGLGRSGRLTEGLSAIEQALALSEQYEERWNLPELLRTKGELLCSKRRLGLRFQPRIASGKRSTGRGVTVRCRGNCGGHQPWPPVARSGTRCGSTRLLVSVYGRFTEGFDTADLKRPGRYSICSASRRRPA